MFSALNIKLHDFKNDLNTKGHGTGSCLLKAKKYLATIYFWSKETKYYQNELLSDRK